jgi:pantoate--beta-alanine ligase
MDIVTTVAALRERLAEPRRVGKRIGLVPTMGYLHDGHLALVHVSVARCDVTVVSIFVNPTQFAANEDLDSYPRDTERDLRLCEEAGTDVVFMPDVDEVYPDGFQSYIEPGPLAEPLCGAFRPGHFRGVATVVAKLFNMVQPDFAYFGRKDFQQVAVVRRMVLDLDMPLEVVTVDTVREEDGVAMSSRNAYLDADERARATCINQGLFAARAAFEKGEHRAERLLDLARKPLSVMDSVQYVEIVDAETLRDVSGEFDRPVAICVAGYIGKTRLIDNIVLEPAVAETVQSAA